MQLKALEIRNFRSLFADASNSGFELELAGGMNLLVGPNNSGKSNVFRALAVALDPTYRFDRSRDMPAIWPFAKPTVTLTFAMDKAHRPEHTLATRLTDYENAVRQKPGRTYASEGIARFRVVIEGGESSAGTRRRFFLAKGSGGRALGGEEDLLKRALAQFDRCIRFVAVQSGESLQSVLEGRFREILRTVMTEHLTDEYRQAQESRQAYSEALQNTLLAPLVAKIAEETSELFPEVTGASLQPAIPDLDETLAKASVRIRDSVDTPLAAKGTGIRGGVIVSMLHYLAENSRRSLVCAIEEPESFLHPAAQETIREDLEKLSQRKDLTLLVTTHSPFIVSRLPDSAVFAVDKDADGRTVLTGTAAGNQPKAALLGNLFRDPGLPELLEKAAEIPSTTRGILLVEGWTDQIYLEVAAATSGRLDLLEGLHIAFGGGTEKLVAQAIIIRERVRPRRLLILLDCDAEGDRARDKLRKFNFQMRREVVRYGDVFDGTSDFPYEAEDLFPQKLVESFIEHRGEQVATNGKKWRPDGTAHWDIKQQSKGELAEWIRHRIRPSDCERWIMLLERIRAELKLGDPRAPATGSL